jgi:hypothetical protein
MRECGQPDLARSRFFPVKSGEHRHIERFFNGAQPIGPLGMPGRHGVAKENRIGNQKGRHQFVPDFVSWRVIRVRWRTMWSRKITPLDECGFGALFIEFI